MQLISKLRANPAVFYIAHELVSNEQDAEYWRSTPVPIPVRHKVAWEATRGRAIFVLPFLFIVLMTQALGYGPFFTVLFGGVLMGYLLNIQLEVSMHKLQQLQLRDRGRYRAVHAISRLLDTPPENITLAFVERLAHTYDAASRELMAKTLRQASRSTAKPYHAERSGVAGLATQASVVALTMADEPASAFEAWQPSYQSINPASGLPMVAGDFGWDIGGNLYGFNDYQP